MRLYHFVGEKHALDNLEHRRLKIAEIDKLNDPFELLSMAQGDRRVRADIHRWLRAVSKRYGILCFSATWRNPVLWAHYADGHRGICLGFDVCDHLIERIKYQKTRSKLCTPVSEATMRRTLYTKFFDWSYEKEWRVWLKLDSRDPATRFYFKELDKTVQLAEIIVGPLCEVSKRTVDSAIRHYPCLQIKKARLAFNTYRVVKDLRGLRS
jgi:hypothetical protein